MVMHAPAAQAWPARHHRLRVVLVRYRRALLTTAAVLVLIGVGVYRAHEAGLAERGAVLGMPPAVRAELYAETLRSTELLCGRARTEEALLDRCVAAADFLARFPECDDSCQSLSRIHHVRPTR
jgi:hypothetical protein